MLLLIATLSLLLCSCADKTDIPAEGETNGMTEEAKKEDIIIFADGEYKCNFVYPTLIENEVSALRNRIRASFKNKTGITAPFKTDDSIDIDSEAIEILLGNTNRPESDAPEEVGENDSFYTVAVIGKKVVINGSDPYQLGLAIDYFTEKYLTGDKTETLGISPDLFEQKILKDHTRDSWGLYGVPAYTVGQNKLVQNVYNCGTTVKDLTNGGINDTSSKLHLITDTTVEEFSAYMEKLERFGYEKENEANLENNLYATYYNGEHRVHISYTPAFERLSSEARVILDPTGMSVKEFGYTYTPKDGEKSVFYQYGIPMTDGAGNNNPNCGSLDIIKCADNSIIIIDGGDRKGTGYVQMTDVALAGLDDFLHEITGIAKGEKIRISAWYMTHYHNDHTYGFYHFLNQYSDTYTLERIIANVPTNTINSQWNTQWWFKILAEWNTLLKAKYPECKELKVHSGQTIQIADVSLQVLYTHEDLLTTTHAFFNSGDSNDTSTVIRIDNGNLSMMVIGDANSRTSSRLRRCFTTETLKSDIMHAAHHMLYHLPKLYDYVDPEIFYLSTSRELLNSEEQILEGTNYKQRFIYIYSLVGDNYYCSGNETVGFSEINDGLTPDYFKDGVVGRG